MKMYFFRGKPPNFGDELNPWLMPKVFPGLLDEDESHIFLGIGSIIFDIFPESSKKIVFGSGYGGYTRLPKLDEQWSFYCVRGPRTAQVCNLPLDKVAGDAAILINRHYPLPARTGSRFAFMPHWQSVNRGNWAEACKLADIDFIDPTRPIGECLEQLSGCKALIAEAMHGAIVADALRVPWIPVLPIHKLHRMKWYDWAEALDVDLQPHRLWPSSTREAAALRGRGEGVTVQNPRGLAKPVVEIMDRVFVRIASNRLTELKKMPQMQSADAALERALDKLETSAAAILREYR